MVKKILATKELTVNIDGAVYDALLIPRDRVVDVEYPDTRETGKEETVDKRSDAE